MGSSFCEHPFMSIIFTSSINKSGIFTALALPLISSEAFEAA